MKITLDQYPGLVQNIETLGTVDLSDNEPALLLRLFRLLDAARANVALALAAQGIVPDDTADEPPF
jgi:hypothetical protein